MGVDEVSQKKKELRKQKGKKKRAGKMSRKEPQGMISFQV